ncbi:MAG TPA: hypothetical protein VF725_14715 [Ktedonobacterales bacterium]
MTTPADGSNRMDQAATSGPSDATAQTRTVREPKEKKSARARTQAARVTTELHAVEPEPTNSTPSLPLARADAFLRDDDPDDEGATREVGAVSAPRAHDDPDATILRPSPLADVADVADAADETHEQDTPPPPRRFNTLAGAFNRSRTGNSGPLAPSSGNPTPPPAPRVVSPEPEYEDEILDEVEDDGEDEWALADQPTVVWTPEQIAQMQSVKPGFAGDTGEYAAATDDFLRDTGESASWPPREGAATADPESDYSHHDWRVGLPPRPRPPFPMRGATRPVTLSEQRLAAPDGRVAPPAPSASQAGAQPDPRMERFQELRRQRFEQGDDVGAEPKPMGDVVKQWWSDLRPNLSRALSYQREARASGMHPIPAYVATPATRLGDAFGRIAASAMDLTDRAQQAAAPAIKRIQDGMGQAAQVAQHLISRFEGDSVRQQAPLLGPGRIAVFFRQGVTVGQAQRLLAASAARPMRLIPRKHGFLARVESGKEAEVCERLRQHPYVRDVAYLEFNEYGEPIGGRR